jgi:hypothetical protein
MGILLSISRHVQPEPDLVRRPWRWAGGLLRAH